MRHLLLKSLIPVLALALLLPVTSQGAASPAPQKDEIRAVARSTPQSAFDENPQAATSDVNPLISLGTATAASTSPGVKVGDTWYDYQHHGRMPRMIDWGNDVDHGLCIHFSWMDMASSAFENRKSAVNVYTSDNGELFGEVGIQQDGAYAGYVGIDVASDNHTVIGCHNDQGYGFKSHFFYDYGPIFLFFGESSPVDDSVSAYVTGQNWQTDSLISVIWPDFKYQDVPGQTPVTHVFSMCNRADDADPRPIAYFRKVGEDWVGSWDYPPYVVDTVFGTTWAQTVACSNTDGKMALVWIANRPDDGDVDTASSQDGQRDILWDNDIYYQISYDYGATFQPRVNLTKNVDGEEGWRPYTDLSPLIDSDNYLHIAWNGRFWPANAGSGGDADAEKSGWGTARRRSRHTHRPGRWPSSPRSRPRGRSTRRRRRRCRSASLPDGPLGREYSRQWHPTRRRSQLGSDAVQRRREPAERRQDEYLRV